MVRLFRAKAGRPDIARLPRHVAIIMDGNGRWAKKRGLPRTAGHVAGAEAFRRIATYCRNIGIQYLTVYAFSTENWKRPPEEVDAIMRLLHQFLEEALRDMELNHVKVRFLGDTSVLSDDLKELITKTEKVSSEYKGAQINLCVNYGGRDEIIKACRKYGESVKNGEALELSEETFSKYIYTGNMPDPDFIIRPGGEKRLSNFLMWQSAYSELYFTDVLWPDFDEKEMDKALEEYSHRKRRYGDIK